MLSPVPIKVNENTYTSWVTWLVVKTILRLFIVQLPLYSIPAYQSYHSKKKATKTQKRIHNYISVTKQLHNFKEGQMEF